MGSSGSKHFRCRSVAERYARAIFELALDAQRVDETLSELNRFDAVFCAVNALPSVLREKELSREKKLAIVREIAKVLSLSPTVNNAICLLIDKGRISIFHEIAVLYKRMAETYEKLARVEASVADASLKVSFKEKIERIMSDELKRKVVCDIRVDPSLIGGATIRIGDVSCDTSISGSLSEMRDKLL
jgi:F-type H+-transporting ATPase subunit delta